jgi:hypothetical protein
MSNSVNDHHALNGDANPYLAVTDTKLARQAMHLH